MEQELSKAFTEVYEILKITPIELTSKIPTKFCKIIEENRDKDYKFQLEDTFDSKDLKEETIVVLGLIYRDFLADPEEKEELQLRDTESIKKVEEEMNTKYNIDNIFKKDKKSTDKTQEMEIVIYKERFIKKLFNLIKGIFRK